MIVVPSSTMFLDPRKAFLAAIVLTGVVGSNANDGDVNSSSTTVSEGSFQVAKVHGSIDYFHSRQMFIHLFAYPSARLSLFIIHNLGIGRIQGLLSLVFITVSGLSAASFPWRSKEEKASFKALFRLILLNAFDVIDHGFRETASLQDEFADECDQHFL